MMNKVFCSIIFLVHRSGHTATEHTVYLTSFCQMPEPSVIEEYLEPMVKGTIICPDQYLGNVTSLCLVLLFFSCTDFCFVCVWCMHACVCVCLYMLMCVCVVCV